MPGAVIGGNRRYPTLQSITDLFRASVNDDFEGATNTPGEGLINYNTAPHVLTFLTASVRDVYSDLRNVGDPELILDNYILFGLPALAVQNPAVQVSLSYAGFFDGFMWHPEWTLPITCHKVERLWERAAVASVPNPVPAPTSYNIVSVAMAFYYPDGRTPALQLQITFDQAAPMGTYSFTGLVNYTALNGVTLTSTSQIGNMLTFPAYPPAAGPYGPTGDTGTATLAPSATASSSGGQYNFVPMNPAPFGLPGIPQGMRMGSWEMRQNAIWMPGCLQSIDLRIRCRITFPDFLNPQTLDFTTAYIPILDCQNAVEAGMRRRYATRFAPDQKAGAIQDYDEAIGKLKLEVVRQMQTTEYQRTEYGDAATNDFAASWKAL